MGDIKYLNNLFREWHRIMEEESVYNKACYRFLSRPNDFYQTSKYLMEIAKNSLVLRGWCNKFRLTENKQFTVESDGSHTNLMRAMVKRVLFIRYGKKFEDIIKVTTGYSLNEIDEAILLHDLPENKFGDWLDDGSRDEAEKTRLENEFYDEFERCYLDTEDNYVRKVRKLLDEMTKKEKDMGCLLYTADKVALIVITLTIDKMMYQEIVDPVPIEKTEIRKAVMFDTDICTDRDKQEMAACDPDHNFLRQHLASQMFTTDFLKIRGLNQYDHTGIFTGLIVMMTLMVRGKWYDWREQMYEDRKNAEDH